MRSKEEIEHALEEMLGAPQPTHRDSFAFGYSIGRGCALRWVLSSYTGTTDTGTVSEIVTNQTFKQWAAKLDEMKRRLEKEGLL